MGETKEASIKIDSDIKSTIASYLKEYNNNNNDQEKVVPDDVTEWFSSQIQIERDRWLEKIKVALQEIDVQRRNTLGAQSVIQQCCDQLTVLLQCFDIGDEVLRDITEKESKEALPKCVEILTEICNSMMEEHFECLDILGIEQNGFNLAVVLKQTIDELLSEAKDSSLERENQNLYEELNNLKNLLYQKQNDVESLQKQLNEINVVIEEQMLAKSEVKEEVQDHQKVEIVLEKPTKNANASSKPPSLSNSVLFEIVPSVTKLDTRDTRSERISSEKSTATCMSSNKGYGHRSDRSTAASQSLVTRDRSYIQISEEKLRALKIQAKKLETSLHDAISSMDKFNKKCYVGDKTISSVSSSVTLSNVLAKNTKRGDYSTSRLLQDLKVPSWHRQPLEIKGSHSSFNGLDSKMKVTNSRNANSEGRRTKDESTDEVKVQEHCQLSQRAFKRQGPVAKCLRCQKLFRKIDNHKLACCYHPKPKERFEKYNNSGQLLRVMYVWKCCRHEIEHEGCCFGQHV
ncbi:uncharacterized protein LOC126824503 [Patella vulgata]|uniref:uncharacterized protein LOC126824503 n=1 Tax=Patella vulgata TaxID=6465 RepID=UPI00217F24C0|nr:uncharacterized protein LOC126824503 [Patella vulgata]